MTPKQEKFIQGILEGKSQADAYRSAYSCNNMSDKTIHEAASRLMADSKVAARISVLRELLTNELIMSAQKRLEWLTMVIQNKEEATSDKLRAIDLMNKMQGEYVQKVEAEVNNVVTINIDLVDDDE